MEINPLHTKVDKFPRAESNLYCISSDEKVTWSAEKPDPYTLYSRVKLNEDGVTLSTYTLSGHACELDLKTGKILSKTSIQ